MPATFIYTRTIATPDGGSAFETVDVPMQSEGAQRAISETFAATAISFRTTPGAYAWDWHTAPRRRLIVMLGGTLEVVVSSGEARTFGVGDVLEVTDTTGQGHISRSADGRDFQSAFIDRDSDVVRAEPARAEPTAPPAIAAFEAYQTRAAEDGASVNARVPLPFVDVRRSGSVTADHALTGFQIAWASGDLDSGWHTTGRRQVVLPLTGGMDVEASRGPRFSIPPGGIYFSEDLIGTGHRTRAIGRQPRLAVFAHFA
ncbi:MAG: hypothetical protein AAFR23_02830 [Pseudomonadota bacterium]